MCVTEVEGAFQEIHFFHKHKQPSSCQLEQSQNCENGNLFHL